MNIESRYNYYDILELNANSAQNEVTKAYDRVKATYSGDNPALYTIFSEQEARAFLVLIEEAYSVLGNKNLRSIYDQRLLSGRFHNTDLSYEAIVTASKQMFVEPRQEEKKNTYEKNEAFEKEISSRDIWDGEFLQKVRDYKKITVAKMSEITKINSYYVKAIEKMDHAGLPALVFVRGYVVQIAKVLGLDEKKVADSYMKVLKENTPQK
ncbi:helix-turn-helix domain-containing protein [Bdellovibrio sp. HCB337]|uniref:helix-turn-helix domain-containing protein n=1 Tax=Bdellovibrio sp. HCB337 TaxID=3394358 RepID=UPI0039A5A264